MALQYGKAHSRLTETLDNAFLVVILSTASLGPAHQSLEHDFLGARKEQDKRRFAGLPKWVRARVRVDRPSKPLNKRLGTHGSVEFDGLVHLSGEPVDQESSLAIFPTDRLGRVVDRIPHGVLKELETRKVGRQS